MNDFVVNVRQIMEYPLKGEASSADAVLLQTGALGGPYAWTTAYGLVVGALDWPGSQLGVGIPLPGNAIDTGLLATHLLTPLGCTIGWNWYTTGSGLARLAPGNAAQLCYDGSDFSWRVSVAGDDFDRVLTLDNSGYANLRNTLRVARDPEHEFEVATKGYVDEELEEAVREINRRISLIYDELIGLYNNNTVWSFNGRRGNVILNLGDIISAGGAPLASPEFTGTPTAPTPATGSNSDRVATTAFVNGAVTDAINDVINNRIVSSFNGRHDDVVLLFEDVADLGFAPLYSPSFSGGPTAPTPPSSNSTDRLATTAFVHANLDILYGRVTGDINALRLYLLGVIGDVESEVDRIVRVANEPPHNPREGDLWWDSSKGKNGGNLFIWYDDPTSAQWVVANSGPPGPPGRPGEDALPRLPTRPSHEEPRDGDIWFDPDEWIIHVHAEGGFPQFGYGITGEWNGQYMNVRLFNWRNEMWSPTEPFGPVYVRNEPPESRPNPILGTFWFDRDNGRLSLWDGERWRRIAEED